MPKKTPPTEEQDAALAAALAAQQTEAQRAPTMADRFVQMNELVVRERVRTRLSESTLQKTLELAMNFHVWRTQKDEQEAQYAQVGNQPFPEYSEEGKEEGLVGPDPDETITEAKDDNIVLVDFTPEA